MSDTLPAVQAGLTAAAVASEDRKAAAGKVPPYLQELYWWAYVHPNAVRLFEREWLVNLILFGNYGVLRDAVLNDFAPLAAGRTLQVACVYGDLSLRLLQQLAPDGELHVIDVLAIQLQNLKGKLSRAAAEGDGRIQLSQCDSSALCFDGESYHRVLVFFLLHEQPEEVRRKTLAEALRVLKPGGQLVVVDYHRPTGSNPLHRALRALLRRLEPYADDLWQHEVVSFLPAGATWACLNKQIYFGGLYQKVVITR